MFNEEGEESLDDLVCHFQWLEKPKSEYVKVQIERIILDERSTQIDCSTVSKYLYDHEADRFVEWGYRVLNKYPYEFRTNLLLGCHMFDERLWAGARPFFEVVRDRLQNTSICWHAKVLELVAACEIHQGDKRPALSVFWDFYEPLECDDKFGPYEIHKALQEHPVHTAYEAMIFEALKSEMDSWSPSESEQ